MTELETQMNEKAQVLFQNWMCEKEKRIKKDAIKKSEVVIKGKVTEHLISFFPDFCYNPKEMNMKYLNVQDRELNYWDMKLKHYLKVINQNRWDWEILCDI